jgi:GNAT superfamily N-acetyltransferase
VHLEIKWCGEPMRARELAHFFTENVDPEYISHGELQGPRALSPGEWRSGLPEILEREIEPRLRATQQSVPGTLSQPILVAEDGGALAGMAFVTFSGNAPVPFAIIEDLVVDQTRRSRGIGTSILNWIAAEARARNIRRLFLESGVHNSESHGFFERNGFETCSVVMMRSLES